MSAISKIILAVREKITNYEHLYLTNEQNVRIQLIGPILDGLGWITTDPCYVSHNSTNNDGNFPDYTLLINSKKIIIVEAKNLSNDLQEVEINQLAKYCYLPNEDTIEFGILTNGNKWLLYDTLEKNAKDRIVWQVDILNDNIDIIESRLSNFSYSNIEKLKESIKQNRQLNEVWNEMYNSIDSICQLVSENFIKSIKSKDRNFQIDLQELKQFTKEKIIETFGFKEIKEEENIKITKDKSQPISFVENIDTSFIHNKRNPNDTKIKVVFNDSEVYEYNNVTTTFINTIKKIGVEEVLKLKISRSRTNIISEEQNKNQKNKIGKYWIFTGLSTEGKLKVLNEINERLKLNLRIETFIKS